MTDMASSAREAVPEPDQILAVLGIGITDSAIARNLAPRNAAGLVCGSRSFAMGWNSLRGIAAGRCGGWVADSARHVVMVLPGWHVGQQDHAAARPVRISHR
jgi:hypothetical protein